ncbi:CD276 antigen isoform X2 [Passer montanus]|uniref:CD276 antigen isoform X2 n=1 Tax=Passer montanus TaxID=9160 RepID=UPI001960331A|nr:CD276 antigen isoform X2 [Passer montanus]
MPWDPWECRGIPGLFPSLALSLPPSTIPAFPCVFPQLRIPRGSSCQDSCSLTPALPVPRMPFPLLILALGLAGAMEIQVPEEPVVALFGHDATLLCSFSPDANFSVAELSLIWQLTDTKRLVHGFSGGHDQLQDQGRGYANRTALFYDQLARGNVSLLLRRVRIADEGSFTCFVRVRDYDSAAVALQVAAPYSKPSVHLEPSKDLKPGDVAEVTCHASRGYPEASVLWQDSRGANLTANVTTWQVANEEGLFEVRSVLRVLVEPSVTYSCLVLNAALRQHGHASVTITAPGIPGGGPVGDSGPGRVRGGPAGRPGLRVPPEDPRELPGGRGARGSAAAGKHGEQRGSLSMFSLSIPFPAQLGSRRSIDGSPGARPRPRVPSERRHPRGGDTPGTVTPPGR